MAHEGAVREGVASFTPGPWAVRRGAWNVERVPGSIGSIVSGDGWYVATLEDAAEQEANAALIAAAPELLAALERMTALALGPVGGVTQDMKRAAIQRAQEAIAKARALPHEQRGDEV